MADLWTATTTTANHEFPFYNEAASQAPDAADERGDYINFLLDNATDDDDDAWSGGGNRTVDDVVNQTSECWAWSSSQKLYLLVINVILAGALIVFGLLGNTLAIVVLRSDSKHKTVNFLLQQLAIADSLYLVTCFFFQFLDTINMISAALPYYPFIAGYAYACASVTQTAAVYLVEIGRAHV